MSFSETWLPEFDHETALTCSLLERVPDEKFTSKLHAGSMSPGRLSVYLQ